MMGSYSKRKQAAAGASEATEGHPYTRPIDLLLVCTANQCRSPMAQGLLRARLVDRELDDKVHVHSAGLLEGGAPATSDAQAVVRGLDGHLSRQLTRDLVEGADLIVGMTREHVREAAVLSSDALRRTFTLKELVRRGEAVGPRRADEELDRWLARVASGRSTSDLMGSSPHDDVTDPIGKPRKEYLRVAAQLDDLLAKLVDLVWPARPS